MFLGIITGIILTIGGAYAYDSFRKPGVGEGIEGRPLVNWDVANRLAKNLISRAQAGLARLTGRAKDS